MLEASTSELVVENTPERVIHEYSLHKSLSNDAEMSPEMVSEPQVRSSNRECLEQPYCDKEVEDLLEDLELESARLNHINEEIEEEIITKTKIMTLEKESDDESLEKESLDSFVLETKVTQDKERYQIVESKIEEADTSGDKNEDQVRENIEIDKKEEKAKLKSQTNKYYISFRKEINKFEPRDNLQEGLSINGIYLNIDCDIDPGTKISQWVIENKTVALAQVMNIETALEFFLNTTKGHAAKFLHGLGDENIELYFGTSGSIDELAKKLENALWWEFTGTELRQTPEQYRAEAQQEAIKKAK
ncbi:uncharacterized protein G2W53_039237 [Senna tora]|uniref:Uncharacterized protein n=1 Tax=Senna tora TaxID=362788 RepID=A0A834SP89_9FABA|nr:uncharacterized protein G2W53_039237 [Senna tora]